MNILKQKKKTPEKKSLQMNLFAKQNQFSDKENKLMVTKIWKVHGASLKDTQYST